MNDGSYKQYGSASAGFNAMFGGGRVTTPKHDPDVECDPDNPCDYSGCVVCHSDCEVNECLICLEDSIDRAESLAEGMER